MAKLGPLDSREVRGMLDRLITHFCLGVCVTTVMAAADLVVGAGNLVCVTVDDGTGWVLLLLKLLVLLCLVGF